MAKPSNYTKRTRFDTTAQALYDWHAAPDAFEKLKPPWENVEVVEKTGGIEEPGSRLTIRMKVGPIARLWVAEHHDCIPGRQFRDTQIKGPFAHWVHTHSFLEDGDGAILEDSVDWALPGGALVNGLMGGFVRRKLDRMFEYRHGVMLKDFPPRGHQ